MLLNNESMPITPNIPSHKVLEEDVARYLDQSGYFVASATYHTSMPQTVINRLQCIYNPTALYIRTRADLIAVHKSRAICFECEIKTHYSQDRHDMTLEALPLCHHINQGKLGAKCLYIYRNRHPDHASNVGFWVSSLPIIREVMLPASGKNETMIEWYKKIFREYFPGVVIIEKETVCGSGDPFVIIDETVIRTLHTWQVLIASAM